MPDRREHGAPGLAVGRSGSLSSYEPAELRGSRLKPQYVIEQCCETCHSGGHDRPHRGSASTRCGPASTGISNTPTPGSTRVASALWASQYQQLSGQRWACPDRMVWAVDGDGCFQMTAQELVTSATVENIPIKVALLNNSYLGMVRQWQDMFYEERLQLRSTSPRTIPDYVKAWAESMGCVGMRVDSPRGGSVRPSPRPTRLMTVSVVHRLPQWPRTRRSSRWCRPGPSNSDIVVDPSQR